MANSNGNGNGFKKMQDFMAEMQALNDMILTGGVEGSVADNVNKCQANIVRLYDGMVKQAAHNLRAGKSEILDI